MNTEKILDSDFLEGPEDNEFGDLTPITYDFTPQLGEDEDLIWTGEPKVGIFFKPTDLFLIPFSLVWGGVAFFWEYSVITMGAPVMMAFFGLPFVFIGLYMIFGRFVYDSERRKRTFYGMTESRLLIKTGVFKETVKTVQFQSIPEISINEDSDGFGTIVLGPEGPWSGMYRGTSWPGSNSKHAQALEMIPNVREVYHKILKLQNKKS